MTFMPDKHTPPGKGPDDAANDPAFLLGILETIHTGVWLTDVSDTITYCNAGMCEIAGVGKDELIGRRIPDDFPAGTVREFTGYYTGAKNSGTAVRYDDIEVRTPAGRPSYQSGWLVPRLENGAYTGMLCTVEDVTPRHMALEEVYSLAKFPAEDPSPVFRYSLDGELLYMNQSGRNVFELCGITPGGAAPSRWIGHIREVYRDGTPRTFEESCGGQEFSFRFVPVRGEEYVNVYGINVTAKKLIDRELRQYRNLLEELVEERTEKLTEASTLLRHERIQRTQAEASLEESESRLRSIVGNISDIIFSVNESAVLTYISPPVTAIAGYTPQELVGRPIWEFIHEDDHALIRSRFQAIRHGFIQSAEYRVMTKDGVPKWVRSTSNRVVDRDGGIMVHGTLTDIDRRKEVEDNNRLFRERLETLVDLYQNSTMSEEKMGEFVLSAAIRQTGSTVGFIYLIDEKQGVSRQFNYIDDSAEDCMTAAPKVLNTDEGGLWTEAVRKRAPFLVNDYTQPHPAKKGLPEEHVPLRRLISVPIFDGDDIVLVAAVANKESEYDYTDVHQVIMLMQGLWIHIRNRAAAEQVRESLREKETLLREIHHRVKNNLQIIASLLELQADRLTDRRSAEMLNESINRIYSMGLIHTLLYQTESFSHIDFTEYITRIVTRLGNIYHRDGRDIAVEVHADNIHLNIKNAVPLGLIINEVTANAFKHAFEGRDSGRIRVTLTGDGNGIVLTVTDNGNGLPASLDWRKTESLGLRIVRLLVENQLGGTLAVESDGGTAVRIVLPRPETV